MVLKLQAYNPATGKFKSSSTGTSYQKPRHKGPGHRRTKPMAGPLYTSSEQSCDGSDSRTPPEPSSAAANELVDLTGDSIRPPSRQCNSQQHHNVEVADNRRGNEEDTVGLQVESNALIYSRGENLSSRESEGPGLNSSTTEHSDTNRGPTEIPTSANPPSTLREQPSPSIVSSNHPLYPASPSQQDAVTQAAASQKTADQFFSQPDTLGGDPNARQSQRVELSDEISITLIRTTSQETDSSTHHEILPSASKQPTTKRLRRRWATIQKDPNNISQPINTKNINKTLVPRPARPAIDTTDGEEIASMDQDFDSSISVSTTTTYATSEHIEAAAAVSNMEMEWEIDGDLMGKEVIDGVVYYLVPWKPTLVPEHEINAPELIRSFEKKFQVRTCKQVKGARVTKKATAKHPKSKGRC